MIVFLNGKFVDARRAHVSIFDNGFLYGDGVFDTLRAFKGCVWNVRAHVDRFYESARRVCITLPWKKEKLVKWIEQTAEKNNFAESRIRLTATRGESLPGASYDFTSSKKPTLLITALPAHPWPAENYKKGIHIVTFNGVRTYPEVKTTSLIISVVAARKIKEFGAQEAVLVGPKNFITECTSCNLLCIKNGKLLYPHTRVLAGTTLDIVKKLARKLGMKVERRAITKAALKNMDEVFVTSVTRGVMPVARIDEKRLKKAAPGPYSKKLKIAFDELIEEFKNRS